MANLRVDKITSTETFETTGSVQFDGVDDGLTVTDVAAFDLGTGDLTIEGWYYLADVGAYLSLFDFRGSGADGVYPSLFRNNTGNYIYYYVDSAQRISNVAINYNTWFHVAVCRSSGITRLFLNGKEKGSFQDSFNYVSRDILLGLSSSNSNDLQGNISNYRVVKGKAIYTKNFKIPMRELEVTPETILLACQSKTDATLEKTGKTITANGNASACHLTPGLLTPVPIAGAGSAITGSVEFDGFRAGLTLPKSTDFAFGTGDFTIEGWFNVSDTGAIRTIFDSRNTDTLTLGIFVGINDNDNLYTYGFPSGTGVTNYGIPKHGEWHHFAVVRNGSNGFVFLNGIKVSGSIDTSSTNYTQQGASIGQPSKDAFADNLYRFKGFLSNIRVNKGTALYTDNFIPPTRELKRVPGTVLLCCQDSNDPTQEVTRKSISLNGFYTYDTVVQSGITTTPTPSNFTPQVGDDRKVTFEGVTRINSNAYFYLPTGDTESRDKGAGTRGISFGGSDASNRINTINFINISTTGHAKDFGDLLDKINQQAAAGSTTRAISAGGFGTSPVTNEIVTMNYITTASTGDALDFGDLTLARRLLVGCSSQTRGIFAGGYDSPNKYNTMDYVTIATQGDALDFGDMSADGQTPSGRYSSAGYASPTRGVWHGGYGFPAYRNIIDYVTISSRGNTKDFGDSSIANYYMGGCSNSIRGISGGAFNPSGTHQNLIEYTTIATTGNAQDFGDLIQRAASTAACASQIRGVFLGGSVGGNHNNAISFVTLMTMGNAQDFGDLTTVIAYNAGASNGHGGLG